MLESHPDSEREQDDAGVRRLFAAVLASALADAVGVSFLGQGPVAKRTKARARKWLREDPRAERVCRLAGRDPEELRALLERDPDEVRALVSGALDSGAT